MEIFSEKIAQTGAPPSTTWVPQRRHLHQLQPRVFALRNLCHVCEIIVRHNLVSDKNGMTQMAFSASLHFLRGILFRSLVRFLLPPVVPYLDTTARRTVIDFSPPLPSLYYVIKPSLNCAIIKNALNVADKRRNLLLMWGWRTCTVIDRIATIYRGAVGRPASCNFSRLHFAT